MKAFFSLDSPFFRFCAALTDLIGLNLLWLMCCLPVFTAGAATAAMYDVLFRILRKDCSGIARPFFAAFRSNFRKATIEWLIMLLAAFLVALEYYLLRKWGLTGVLYMAIPVLDALIWLFVNTYLFPLTARFENSVANTFKNALILSVSNFPRTLIAAVLQASPFILALSAFDIFYKTSFLWLILGGSGIAYINALMQTSVFAKLIAQGEHKNAPD